MQILRMISCLRFRGLQSIRFLSQVSRRQEEYTPVIGLEVHVQLATKTKLFSRAPALDDSPPNSLVAPFDMAEPGTLPQLNKAAVMHAIRMAILLNCEIPSSCRFDRKHYFYADMPAGYQITQNNSPIAKNGYFGFHVYSENIQTYWKEIEIIQLQLEQDSGKTIHSGNTSLIDLNRAGVPLVEVVTRPSFSTALEALCFVQQLRLILIHYGICDGELHKGHMRIDANVSLSTRHKPGVRTEIKNMNSLRHLHLAVNYEIDRQFEILSKGGIVLNETRACDQQGRTVSMRDKEEETDYRFLPEPNLPTLQIQPEWVENCRKSVVQTQPKYQKFIDLGFTPRQAIHFEEEPLLSNFIINCSDGFNKVPIDIFVFWLKELKQMMQRSKAVYPPQSEFFGKQFIEILRVFHENRITKLRAIEMIRSYITNAEKRSVLESSNYWKVNNNNEIDKVGKTVFEKNESLVNKARNKNAKAIAKLRSAIVEASQKRVDADDATECVIRFLSKSNK